MVKKVLDNHAPIKQKAISANNGRFVTKALRKAIMQRSKLRNKFTKERSEENLKVFKRKRNECVKLVQHEKAATFFWHTESFFRPTFVTVCNVG